MVGEPLLASLFEERAKYLSKTELAEWTAVTQADRTTLSKLKGPGAKLLIGPRGSGKSTLLRQAYFETQDEDKHLAVYVNYSKSLALEPLFHKTANALQIFRQWVLMKIAIGAVNPWGNSARVCLIVSKRWLPQQHRSLKSSNRGQ